MAEYVSPKAAAPVAEKPVVNPNATAAPEAPPAEVPEGDLPDELLQIPAIGALLVGQPAALSAPIAQFEKRPEAQLIAKNKTPLMSAGIGLYRTVAGDTGVIFNQRFIAPADIQAADKAGSLNDIAPNFDQVNQQLGASGAEHPMMSAEAGPEGFAVAQPPAAPTSANVPPPPASVPRQAQAARVKALTPGGPTKGARPGAGRLINNILRPPV